jgi:hypothetical protein
MMDQPRHEPLEASPFFPDGRAARPLVPGTVPRGHLQDDPLLETGWIDGKPAEVFPFPVTAKVLERGRERYGIFCTPCHDRAGYGRGMIVQRGFRAPSSFHIDRLREIPAGHFVDVITRGFGAMPSYKNRIPPSDRWAITAYVRALQLSQQAPLSDVPEAERRRLLGGG